MSKTEVIRIDKENLEWIAKDCRRYNFENDKNLSVKEYANLVLKKIRLKEN